jgi:type IX secretion system PorP/SprF family membrane protein
MIRKVLSSLVLMFWATIVMAQDIHTSQFTMSPLLMNAASSGGLHLRDVVAVHRNQWSAVTNPFKTFIVAANTRFGDANKTRRGFWGAGLLAFNDKAGDANMRTNAVGLNAAYHIRLSQYQHLGFGLQGMYMSRFVDFSKLQWGSQYDGSAHNSALSSGETANQQNFGFADVNAGIYYTLNNTSTDVNVFDNNFRQLAIGLAFHHITTPKYAFGTDSFEEDLYVKMVLHGNALWSLSNSSLAIAPNFAFYKQGPHESLNIGSMVRLAITGNSKYTRLVKNYAVYGGLNYRLRDAIITTGMVEYGNYQFGLSYDFNISKLALATAGRGGVEFNFRMLIAGSKIRIMTSGMK